MCGILECGGGGGGGFMWQDGRMEEKYVEECKEGGIICRGWISVILT